MFAFDFDPDLPLEAASEFPTGDGIVRAGDAFDWRARGMSEIEVVPMMRAGLLVQRMPCGSTIDYSTAGERRTFVIDGEPVELTSGPAIHVETPAQRDQRRKKR